MKAIDSRKIKIILQQLGLKSVRGNGTGHEQWVDVSGNRCLLVLRHKDVSWASLYSLGEQLEANKVCNRKQFLAAARQA
jgi:hypothetical protein